MWDDDGLCEPDIARARAYPCCVRLESVGSECDHALVHQPGFAPGWIGGELLLDVIPGAETDEERWLWAVHGSLHRKQPAPVGGWDAWVVRVDGVGVGISIGDDLLPNDERDLLVREFLVTRQAGSTAGGWIRPLCFMVRRPDPLFRLTENGRRLWFDARWPLPDGSRPLRVLTGSRSSAGWTDLAPAHGGLEHVNALGSTTALVAALADSARPARWGGVILTRGGGGIRGHAGDWRQMFDAPEVVDAVRALQATGLPVLVGVGHEADETAVEAAADFTWATPSLLAAILARWRGYLSAETHGATDGLEPAVYSAGRAVRQAFDEAWLRTRYEQGSAQHVLPKRTWPPSVTAGASAT